MVTTLNNLIKTNLILFLNLFLLLISFPLFVLFKNSYDVDMAVIFGSLYCVLMLIYLAYLTKSYFSPMSIFISFYWMMLMGRPFLVQLKLFNAPIVSASKYDLNNVFEVNVYITLTIMAIGMIFIVMNRLVKPSYLSYKFPEILISNNVLKVIKFLFFVFGLLMIKDGVVAYQALQQSNYIQLISSGEIEYFNQTFYTIVKWSWFLIFITDKKNRVLYTILFLFFLLALPVSGMRGYFILYILLVLMILEGLKITKLKLTIVLPFVFGLLYLVTFLLEYRIGFSVTDKTVMSPIYKAIYDQGSTYEVIYGVYTNLDKLNFVENVLFPKLNEFPVFGDYVDKLRGVDFADGIGFATSAIGEVMVGGFVIWAFYILMISFALSYLHKAFLKLQINTANLFILFFLSPIIWGQPRGAIIQFVIKFCFFIALTIFFKIKQVNKIKI